MTSFDPTTPSNKPITDSRHSYLVRTGAAKPHFLQGVFPFAGKGVYEMTPLDDELTFVAPQGCTLEVLYVRAGNFSEDLIYLVLTADGITLRYFPVGPKSNIHVPLAITEQHPEGTVIGVSIGAPRGVSDAVVVDIGMLEITADSEV